MCVSHSVVSVSLRPHGPHGALQAPLSMGFFRQESWSGLPFPFQGIFLTQGLNLGLLHCRQILLLSEPPGKPRGFVNFLRHVTYTCGLIQADLGLEVFSFSTNRDRVRERGNKRRGKRVEVWAPVLSSYFPFGLCERNAVVLSLPEQFLQCGRDLLAAIKVCAKLDVCTFSELFPSDPAPECCSLAF